MLKGTELNGARLIANRIDPGMLKHGGIIDQRDIVDPPTVDGLDLAPGENKTVTAGNRGCP